MLLPFAKRRSDDQLVSPEEVPRGLACGCVCPECGQVLLSKQGTEKVWHFAHTKSGDCSGGYEISVHELAKQLIHKRKLLLIPKLEVELIATGAFGETLTETETLFEATSVVLDECKAGVTLDAVTSDVWGMLRGREILVEITVFHRLMPERRQRLIETRRAAFQIDLSEFKTKQATRKLVEDAVFENVTNRKWIFHPRATECPAVLQERLQRKMEESKVARERLEAIRSAEEAAWGRQRESRNVCFSSDGLGALLKHEAVWRAAFPSVEQWKPARKALCSRLGLTDEAVNTVMDSVTRRSHLAGVLPSVLAEKWAKELNAPATEILRYFYEAGFTLEA